MKVLLRKTYFWNEKIEVKSQVFCDLKSLLDHWQTFKEERKGLLAEGAVKAITVRLIDTQKALPRPKGETNGIWCPYCASLTNLKPHRTEPTYQECCGCGVSDQDFYFRKFNGRP